MLAENIAVALDAQQQRKGWTKRRCDWQCWRTSGIVKQITMSCWERVGTEERQERELKMMSIGFASVGKVSDRGKDEKQPQINADYADIVRTSQALAISLHANVGIINLP
jgi:hypothetical protein